MAERGRKLNARQKKFVQMYVANGGFAAPAAREAGYTAKNARFNSHKFLDLPHVLAAIREEVQKRLDASVAIGARVLVELAEKAKSESVKLAAGEALLNRGGMRLAGLTEHRHEHRITDERSDAELRARVIELQRELGIKTIDGEVIRPALPARVSDDVVIVEPEPAKPADDIFS